MREKVLTRYRRCKKKLEEQQARKSESVSTEIKANFQPKAMQTLSTHVRKDKKDVSGGMVQ